MPLPASFLLQMAEQPQSTRRLRNVQKPNREDIYCYDLGAEHLDPSHSDDPDDELKSDYDLPQDDDSFSYNGGPKKLINRKKNPKDKPSKDPNSKKPPKKSTQTKNKEISHQNIPGVNYVDFVPSSKPAKEIKIFNPILHQENKTLKDAYEKELQSIQEAYGRRMGKSEQPAPPPNRWNFLLRQVEQVTKQILAEREQRTKFRRKVAKFAQNFYNRKEVIKQQRGREEEKVIRKQSLELMRLVKRKFWGSALKVHKIVMKQQEKNQEKQSKMRKLQDLVAKQFQASEKITNVLKGYQEVSLEDIKVSQVTRVPVIINIDRKPNFRFSGLHQDNIIRPSLLIKFPLREYQLLGVYWIYTLHNRGMNAILADQMGLGKTIQTIALLAHLAMEKGIWGPHLVIVPTTILINWEIQFKRWCPAFKIMTYFGTPKQRKSKRKGWSKLNTFHVCITSYKIAVTDHPIFRRKKWYYMILDEAQNIKNFKSQRWQILLNFKTRHRLLLTGTPLQNDLTQLWSLLHFLMPKIFNSFDDFNEWFNIPFQEALQKNFPISQEILKKLHTVLRPFFLRRLKKDVETQLPKKTEFILRCSMSRRQKYLYDQMIWHQNKRNRNHQTSGIMNVLMSLKKICNHPDLFQPRIEETPLGWSPLTLVIAHHMFLKQHFQTNKIHVLRDFVSDFKVGFKVVANDILRGYAQLEINPDNQIYYRHKFADRLRFAAINYERSRRQAFRPYSIEFSKLEIVEEVCPYFLTKSITERALQLTPIFDRYLFVVPRVMASPATLATFPMSSEVQAEHNRLEYLRNWARKAIPIEIQRVRSRFLLHFPNKSIILYDSGKLIKLVFLLKSIKYRGQKALIFTQMTKMLDIFEKVLNMFKFNYVRLDGNTKTEMRQTLVQRFNNDPRILCFISSTRSGGIGLNLTGASNVIFYDTDWNPAMDKQAQDRCHRIGQTRDVNIYRLITEHSIQENILMKSIHKRKLETLVTEEGMFNTSYFQKVNLKGLLQGTIDYQGGDHEQGNLAEVEDQQDQRLLYEAEKTAKEGVRDKDEDQEQLDVKMLPKLFRYGLSMLENRGATQMSDEESDNHRSQIGDQEVDSELAEQEQEMENKGKQKQVNSHQPNPQVQSGSKRHRNGVKIPSDGGIVPVRLDEQESENEAEQGYQPLVRANMSTLDKLKAMATYQSQYLYMKKNLYEIEEKMEAEAAAVDQNAKTGTVPSSTTKSSKTKRPKERKSK